MKKIGNKVNMDTDIIEKPTTVEQEKLVQSPFNTNVAFYVHLKAYDNNVREELEKRLTEVFFFSKGIDWRFDSFGIEKTGSRGTDVLGYFIFRAIEIEKLQKLFIQMEKLLILVNLVFCFIPSGKKRKSSPNIPM